MMISNDIHSWTEYQRVALRALRCVQCDGPMMASESFLSCPSCAQRYPLIDGAIVDVTGGPRNRLTVARRSGQWTIVARSYDRFWRRRALAILTGRPFTPAEELDLAAESLTLDSATVILDNACASGFYSRGLAKRMEQEGQGGVIIANDLSLAMLREARRLATLEGVDHRILFVRSDSEAMPLLNESISGVVCGGSLNEFSSPENVLAEFERVMKSGARANVMMQILSRGWVVAAAQKALGLLTGLQFPTVDQAKERLSRQFHLKVLVQEGLLLIARLSVSGAQEAVRRRESRSQTPASERFARTIRARTMERSVESRGPA